MELPKKIKIAHMDIEVEAWPHRSANARSAYGEFSGEEGMIRIDTTQHPYKVAETFLHELHHAIFWVYKMQDDDEEERTVATFATGMAQVFRDNPHVFKFIGRELCHFDV